MNVYWGYLAHRSGGVDKKQSCRVPSEDAAASPHKNVQHVMIHQQNK